METIIGMIENEEEEEEDRKDRRLDPRITIIQAKDVDHDAKRSIGRALSGPCRPSRFLSFSRLLNVSSNRHIRTRAYGNGIEQYYPSSLVTECDFLIDPTR